MIDALLAPFYKWIVMALLLVLLGYVAYCNSLAKDLRLADQECQTKIETAIKPYQAAISVAEAKANSASKKYEEIKGLERERTEVINNKIETIKERTIYSNVCLDADGVSALNEAGILEYPP
ncbi:hypothetical protein [Acinetobacter tianfuensis]|uniref:DUF2570 domain-containing protein n=1 Tax=Acinetobacter tianfuensis TaxID=2419603 RepID=A0A3A8EHX8_9GAMM|nr:hypothetical protein [Acinetobacter tianfuensis]RKG33718.1 hypothetical protein D7V32_02650 [Acinetobacter tianfuensis]